MRDRSDAELIEEILGGNVEAFGILVSRHRDTCTRFAVRMLGSGTDAVGTGIGLVAGFTRS